MKITINNNIYTLEDDKYVFGRFEFLDDMVKNYGEVVLSDIRTPKLFLILIGIINGKFSYNSKELDACLEIIKYLLPTKLGVDYFYDLVAKNYTIGQIKHLFTHQHLRAVMRSKLPKSVVIVSSIVSSIGVNTGSRFYSLMIDGNSVINACPRFDKMETALANSITTFTNRPMRFRIYGSQIYGSTSDELCVDCYDGRLQIPVKCVDGSYDITKMYHDWCEDGGIYNL
jgi:hypothetical protein